MSDAIFDSIGGDGKSLEQMIGDLLGGVRARFFEAFALQELRPVLALSLKRGHLTIRVAFWLPVINDVSNCYFLTIAKLSRVNDFFRTGGGRGPARFFSDLRPLTRSRSAERVVG